MNPDDLAKTFACYITALQNIDEFVSPNSVILDVGTGSGFMAASLAFLVLFY